MNHTHEVEMTRIRMARLAAVIGFGFGAAAGGMACTPSSDDAPVRHPEVAPAQTTVTSAPTPAPIVVQTVPAPAPVVVQAAAPAATVTTTVVKSNPPSPPPAMTTTTTSSSSTTTTP